MTRETGKDLKPTYFITSKGTTFKEREHNLRKRKRIRKKAFQPWGLFLEKKG
jgi:hypothetical protein